MLILSSVSDAFTNPDSPWYYVVGVAFLLVVIGLLTLFIVLGEKKKKKQENQNKEEEASNESAESVDTENHEKSNDVEEKTDNIDEAIIAESEESNDESKSTAELEQEVNIERDSDKIDSEYEKNNKITIEPAARENEIENSDEKKEKVEELNVAQEKPVDTEKSATEVKPKTAKKPTAKKTATKKTEKPVEQKADVQYMPPVEIVTKKPSKAKTTKTAKPFIDKLIADISVHGIYNELKNTILSYPGIKAKLTKDEENFMFGVDKKAAFKLDGDKLALYLALNPADVPSQFGLKSSDDEMLPVMLIAESGNIDTAQKAIVFAMNVSMLTRNSSHRRVDYVQKAIDAKQRAKTKK